MYGRSRLTYARERVRLTNHLRIRCCPWENRVMFLPTIPGAMAWPAAMIVWGPGYRATAHRQHYPACNGDKGYLDDPKRSWRRVVEMRRRIGAAGRRT